MFSRFKDFIDVEQSRLLGSVPSAMPILVLIVTNRCLLRCGFCFQSEFHKSANLRELSKEQWGKVIDSAEKMGCWLITLTGGEPFLRKDIFEIIQRVNDRGIRLHVCTNGILLDDKKIEKLKKSPPNSMSFSLDGPTAEVHDRLRGQKCFDRTIRVIKALKKKIPSVKIRINFMITKKNYWYLCEMVPLVKKLGADQLSILPIHTNLHTVEGKKNDLGQFLLDKEDTRSLKGEIRRFRKLAKESKLETGSASFLAGIPAFFEGHKRAQYCYCGYASCIVSAEGFVSPCEDIKGEENVKDKKLEEIWGSRSLMRLRQRVRKCSTNCWDTTHAELNIRFSVWGVLREMKRIIKDIRYYRL